MNATAGVLSRAMPVTRPMDKPVAKVLVVEADCFALTTRVDPNVIFWKPGFSKESVPEIPPGVTHVWLSKWVSVGDRAQIHAQAVERGIEIWKCVLGELKNRLLPVWKNDSNRSLMKPDYADDESDGESEDFAITFGGEGALKGASNLVAASSYASPIWEDGRYSADVQPGDDPPAENPQDELRLILRSTSKNRKKKGIDILKRIHAENTRRRAKEAARASDSSEKRALIADVEEIEVKEPAPPQQTVAPIAKPSKPVEISALVNLEKIPEFERMLFTSHYSRDVVDETVTAAEFELPPSNVQKILRRVWGRLQQQGFKHDEAWLLKTLGKT